MTSEELSSIVAIAVSTVVFAGCGRAAPGHSFDASANAVDASANVSFRVSVMPLRQLDMVFMIDNSAGMSPKVLKMSAQFPKLIAALKDPSDGTLPDLRIAIIDSDLGTGGAYSSGSCGPKNGKIYGDLGRFQMIDATPCGVTDANATYLEYQDGQPVNYTGDISTVFACLASGIGNLGCGDEHQLQAFEFALVAKGLGNEGQQNMLRPNALLALVFITDEDDCSAATNDGMFGDLPELHSESASLRCATRAHRCNGRNLTDSPPGYPTTASFSTPFSTCSARTDACSNAIDGAPSTDTSQPTDCSPLRSVKRMAEEIKSLKAYPDDQVVVGGIFGWPISDQDMATATYEIAPIPNPNVADTAYPTVFDLWPVCYDPSHMPANGADFDASAAGWGAAPGLRLSAFVDEFGENGLKFSVCQSDFSTSMSQLGAKLAKQVQNRCLPASYSQYAGCTAHYLIPNSTGDYTRQPDAILSCSASPATPACYTLIPDAPPCATGEFLVEDDNTLPAGTMLEFNCQ